MIVSLDLLRGNVFPGVDMQLPMEYDIGGCFQFFVL